MKFGTFILKPFLMEVDFKIANKKIKKSHNNNKNKTNKIHKKNAKNFEKVKLAH